MNDSKILIAEDHPTSRKLLQAMLKKNYTVIAGASGEEAVELARVHQPDLVLLDIEMPGMDGFQALDKLRNGIISPTVPVIFLTAREDTESRDKGLTAGAVDYITKPYDKHELAIKVKNHLALYEARKEIERTNRIMAQEMEMASQLQRSLLPQSFPPSDRVCFSVVYEPSTQAGGDFYDVIALGKGLIGFAQVDVAGHGVRSAMVGAMFKMAFQTFAKGRVSPAEVLSLMNDEIVDIIPDSDYMTMFYGIIDQRNLQLTYCNAGHPRPFLYNSATKEILEPAEGGPILGAFPGLPYENGIGKLQPGDRMLLYTDGVTEAGDTSTPEGMYGTQRLRRAFSAGLDRAPEPVLESIMNDIRQFQGRDSFEDDVSLMMISIT